jgi:hypothetical protein
MKMELTEGSETSAYINQTPGNYPKGNLLYSVHGESLKSRRGKELSKGRSTRVGQKTERNSVINKKWRLQGRSKVRN